MEIKALSKAMKDADFVVAFKPCLILVWEVIYYALRYNLQCLSLLYLSLICLQSSKSGILFVSSLDSLSLMIQEIVFFFDILSTN